MGQPIKRRTVFETLSRARLLEIARNWELTGLTAARKADIVSTLARKRSIDVEPLLDELRRDELKAVCRALGVDDSGREKAPLVERLLGRATPNGRPNTVNGADVDGAMKHARAKTNVAPARQAVSVAPPTERKTSGAGPPLPAREVRSTRRVVAGRRRPRAYGRRVEGAEGPEDA